MQRGPSCKSKGGRGQYSKNASMVVVKDLEVGFSANIYEINGGSTVRDTLSKLN